VSIDVSFESGFDFGFYSGTSALPDVGVTWPVAINGHGYAVELPNPESDNKFSHDSIPYLKPYFLTEGDINERTLNPDGGWRRSQETWYKGAGQLHLDYDDSDRAMFRSSKGVNVWDRWKLTLLPDTLQAKASVHTNLMLATAGSHLYAADGTDVAWTTDGTSWTALGIGATVNSIASSGHLLWIALASGVQQTTAGDSSASAYNNLVADLLGFCKGRLMAANGPSLFNIVSGKVPTPTGLTVTTQGTAGTTTNAYRVSAINQAGETFACAEVSIATANATLSATNFNRLTWNAMPGATGYNVYGRTSGAELKLASVTATTYDDTGASPSGALPTTDTTATAPDALYTHDDPNWTWVGFATGDSCIYAAGFSGDYSAIYRIGIKSDGTGLDVPVQAGELPRGETALGITGYLGSVVVGTTQGARKADQAASGELLFAPVIASGACRCATGDARFVYFGWENYDTTSTGLGRLDLSVLNNGVPAYATDLMATAQGQVSSVVIWNGSPAFAVQGSGVYVTSTDLVPSGSLESGTITFNVPDPKVALYNEVRHPTPMVGAFTVNLAAEDGPFTKLATRSEAGQDVVISANETHGRNFELQLVLATGTDPTASPEIRGYTLICLPASQSGETYTVGLKLYPEQQVNGYDVYMDVAAELAFLKALRANKTVFKYQEGATSYTATLEDYSWRPEFTEDGDAYCGVFWAVMKSLTPPSAS